MFIWSLLHFFPYYFKEKKKHHGFPPHMRIIWQHWVLSDFNLFIFLSRLKHERGAQWRGVSIKYLARHPSKHKQALWTHNTLVQMEFLRYMIHWCWGQDLNCVFFCYCWFFWGFFLNHVLHIFRVICKSKKKKKEKKIACCTFTFIPPLVNITNFI